MVNNFDATRPERRIVTVNEAAAMLRISRASAYEAVRRKEIPTIRIGRRLLVSLTALERMLACNTDASQEQVVAIDKQRNPRRSLPQIDDPNP